MSERDDRAVLDKAFGLLDVLHEADRPLGVSELARRSGMSKSTAFRVLSTLERNGAVAKVGTTYCLGSRLRGFSTPDNAVRDKVLRELVTPFLVDAHVATGSTIHLGVLDGADVRYLNKVHGHRSTLTRVSVGHAAPAVHTASGRLLLAHAPDTLDAVLAGTVRPRTSHSLTDPADIRQEIGKALSHGYYQESDQAVLGVSCLALPLKARGAAPVAAVTMACSSPAQLGRHLPAMRRVVAEASRALAASGQLVGNRPVARAG